LEKTGDVRSCRAAHRLAETIRKTALSRIRLFHCISDFILVEVPIQELRAPEAVFSKVKGGLIHSIRRCRFMEKTDNKEVLL